MAVAQVGSITTSSNQCVQSFVKGLLNRLDIRKKFSQHSTNNSGISFLKISLVFSEKRKLTKKNNLGGL